LTAAETAEGQREQAEYREIQAAADIEVPEFAAVFERAVAVAREAVNQGMLAAAVDAGDPVRAMDAIPWGDFDRALDHWREGLLAVMQRGGQAAARHLSARLAGRVAKSGGTADEEPRNTRMRVDIGGESVDWSDDSAAAPDAGMLVRFDLLNPKALRWAEEHAAALVREVTEETRGAIRDAIARAFSEGLTADETARRIRSLIGLTTRQALAVENYARFLDGVDVDNLSDADKERLRRGGLRANQFGTLRASGMSEEQVESLLEGYQARLIRERAETIARTETITAANAGQHELWRQALAHGWIGPATSRKWIATPGSDRTCSSCMALHGVVVGLDEPFPGGLMHPTRHPRCRCATALVFGEEN
jgi:SPP1 gp7 family putative phage head morphogenesis protein